MLMELLALELLPTEPLELALPVLEQLVPELAGDKAMELPTVNKEPVSGLKSNNSNHRH